MDMQNFESYRQIGVPELVFKYLHREGVSHVFGLPGGYIYPFLKLLRGQSAEGIQLIISRHEEGAAFMADGYARVTGKLGVVFTTAGPGATNALTGVACAHKDHSPLLLISGCASTASLGLGAWQESSNAGVNTTEVFRHATAFSEFVSNVENFHIQFGKALKIIHSTPNRAAHLCVPLDVSNGVIQKADISASPLHSGGNLFQLRADSKIAGEAFQMLLDALNPVIYLGNGARQALQDPHFISNFLEFLGRHSIPVMTSPKAKGIFPGSHPLSLGVFGLSGNRTSEEFLAQIKPDALMVIGSSLNEWSSGRWSELLHCHKMIHVDINNEVPGLVYRTDLEIQAEAKSFLQQLIELSQATDLSADTVVRIEKRGSDLAALKNTTPKFNNIHDMAADSSPIKPQRLMAELDKFAHGKAINFFIDMGNCTGFFNHYTQIDPPNRVFAPYGFSSMGWANAAVIGGKVGDPERINIAISGDGAFLMNGVEVQSAARHRIGAVYLILFDNHYGTVHHGEMSVMNDLSKMDDNYYCLGEPDLTMFAKSLGAEAYYIEKPEEIIPSLEKACERADSEKKPQVIVFKIDHKEKAPFGGRYNLVKPSK